MASSWNHMGAAITRLIVEDGMEPHIGMAALSDAFCRYGIAHGLPAAAALGQMTNLYLQYEKDHKEGKL